MMMKRMRSRSAALAALSVVGCLSKLNHTTPPPERKLSITLPVKEMEISNGLSILLLPEPSADVVEVDLRLDAGSAEDPPGKAGLAHLAEHLSFQIRPQGAGTPTIGTWLADKAISYNAETTWDYTHTMTFAPENSLGAIIGLEAARLGGANACASIDEATFQREREVVRNELREDAARATGDIPALLLADAYPEDHRYHRAIGGDDVQVAALTRKDVCDFLDRWYAPQHARLVISGGVDEGALGAKLDPLTKIRHHGAPVAAAPDATLAAESRRVTHELAVEETTIFVMWPLPAQYAADDAAARVVVAELERRARFFGEKYEYATSVASATIGGPRAPVLVLAVSLKDAGKVDTALDDVWRSAAGVVRDYKSEMLDHTKNQLTAEVISGMASLPGRTRRFADYAQFASVDPFLEIAAINAVTVDKVKTTADGLLGKGRAVVAIVKPKAGAGRVYTRASLSYAGEVDGDSARTGDTGDAGAPAATPKGSGILAAAKRFTLGNGMRVVLLPAATLPVVSVRLVFRAGTAQEPADKAGLATVAAVQLTPQETGTAQDDRDVDALVAFYRSGAALDVDITDDDTTFKVDGLSMYVDLMVRGLERMVKNGNYSQDDIEQFRGRQSARLRQASYVRELEFGRALYQEIYGDDHPYATRGFPTAKSVGKINRDETYAFKAKHYTASNGTLIVAGSFDAAQVEAYIRETFGDWPKGGADAPVTSEGRTRSKPSYVGVLGADTPVVTVRIAYASAAGVDDLPQRMVLESMVAARVGAVRDRLGASYGASADDHTRAGMGMLVVESEIDGPRAGEGLATIRAAIASLRDQGGSGFDADFVNARRGVLRALTADYGEARSLAGQLAFLAKYGVAADYYAKLVDAIAALTPGQLHALVAAELAPEREVLVCLGARAQLEAAFAKAGVTGVRWVD